MSWFDSLHPAAKALIVTVATAVLSWAAQDLVPVLQDRNPLAAGIVAALVTVLVGWITPVTRSFGVGKRQA